MTKSMNRSQAMIQRWAEYRRKQGKENPEIPYTAAEHMRKYRNLYPERYRKKGREYYLKEWGSCPRGWKQGVEYELFAITLLSLIGFTNVFYASKDYKRLPFDLIASVYNCSPFLIDVTAGRIKRIPPRCRELVRALGLKHYILFIKPDYTAYCLKETNDVKQYYYARQGELIKIE